MYAYYRTQYGVYQSAVALCTNRIIDDEKWKKAIFWVFDTPDSDKPYEVLNKHTSLN